MKSVETTLTEKLVVIVAFTSLALAAFYNNNTEAAVGFTAALVTFVQSREGV